MIAHIPLLYIADNEDAVLPVMDGLKDWEIFRCALNKKKPSDLRAILGSAQSGVGWYKCIILGPIDGLSAVGQAVLLKFLEDYPEGLSVMLYAAQKDAVLPAILSRVRYVPNEARPSATSKMGATSQTASNQTGGNQTGGRAEKSEIPRFDTIHASEQFCRKSKPGLGDLVAGSLSRSLVANDPPKHMGGHKKLKLINAAIGKCPDHVLEIYASLD